MAEPTVEERGTEAAVDPALGNYIYGAFGRDFQTADRERVMVAAISSGQWASLVKACAKEREFAELERSLGLEFRREAHRYEAREAIAAVLEPWFAARSLAQIRESFDQHRVCGADPAISGDAGAV